MRTRLVLVATSLLFLTACPPTVDPGPAQPWTATRFARSVDGEANPFVRLSAWTDDEWFATAKLAGLSTTTFAFQQRSGPGGSVFGPEQTLSTPLQFASFVPGQHGDGDLVGIRGFAGSPGSGGPAVGFLRHGVGGWALVGETSVPNPAVAMNDHWLVTAANTVAGTPAEVTVYPIDATGPTVVLGPGTVLPPDPTWPPEAQAVFGGRVALDGGLVAVTSPARLAPDGTGTIVPGLVRIFRSGAAGWLPAQSLDGATTGVVDFGTTLAVDDGPSVDRVVLTTSTGAEAPYPRRAVQIYADSGSGYHLEQTILPDPTKPDLAEGEHLGNALAIDGDLIAVSSRLITVPSAEAGHAPVDAGYVRLLRRGAAGWADDAEVAPFVTPMPAGFGVMRPIELQVSGEHVAVLTDAAAQECGFEPCFNVSFEAWSLDHTG